MTPKSNEPIFRATSVELYEALSQPMPQEALHSDTGRGFTLTSIKAAFVLERLNREFGLLGYGWRYSHTPHRIEGPKNEALVEVALQWRVCDDPAELSSPHCYPIYWGRGVDEDGEIREGWYFDRHVEAVWSEPVFATGGSATNRKGSVPYTDAFRSAVTNGITKAASRLGIGIEVFKGGEEAAATANHEPSPKSQRRRKPAQPKAKSGDGFTSVTAMREAAQAAFDKLADVPEDQPGEGQLSASVAREMSKLKMDMQPIHLVAILFGPGAASARRLMATSNFLKLPGLTEKAVQILNASRASIKP